MGPTTVGEYEIIHPLGQGGMAQVYEGYDPDLARRVAIKVIHPHLAATPDFEERFRREARLVASLRHPHIVQLYDYEIDHGETGRGRPVMVMEYLPGGSLKERLDALRARGERMAPDEVARLLDALASALDYAHERGAVHRDIKPANVLFTAEDEPVLADFGIAKIVDDPDGLTRSGGLLGTPAYLSPEQAAGQPVDARSDIYSLGVLLYELLTGQTPFRGKTATALLTAHLQEPPPPLRNLLPDIPAAVETVVLRALAKRPEERYPSAGALAAAFREALAGRAAPAPALSEQPTVVEAAPGVPIPEPEESAGLETAPARDDGGWLVTLAERLVVLAPLIGHDIPETYRSNRTATALGVVGLLCAALQFLADLLDLAQKAWRPVALSTRLLPVAAGLLLSGGTVFALYSLVRPTRRLNRRRSAGVFVSIALVSLLWGAWTLSDALRPPTGFVVAIGEFERQSTKLGNPAGDLYVAMEKAFAPLADRITVERTFTAYHSAAEARTDGLRRQATVLIWGWYSDDGVTAQMEALDLPSAGQNVGLTLSIRAIGGAVLGRLSPRSRASPRLAHYVRRPLEVPGRVSFGIADADQMVAAASAILGTAFYLDGDRETALRLLDQAAASLPETGNALLGAETIYFQRGVVLWETGEREKAIADMEEAAALAPQLFEAHYNLAVFYVSACRAGKGVDRAVAEAEAAVAARPESVAARQLLAGLYLQADRPEAALATLQEALATAPDDPRLLLLLAQAHTAAGHAAAAQEVADRTLDRLTGTADEDAEDQVMRGDAYVLAGRYADAITAYRKAISLSPENTAASRGLANALYWQEAWEEAAAAYRQVIALAPDDSDAYLMLGITQYDAGDKESAIESLRAATERTQCDATPYTILGGLYYLEERYAEAAQAYTRALALDPQDADVQYLLGQSYLVLEEWAPAAQAYAAAVALRPDFPEALRSWGDALTQLGNTEEAISVWERYTALSPQDANGWNSLGLAYLTQSRWEDAEQALRAGLAVEERADLYTALGLALNGRGEYQAALQTFQKALELDPQYAGAYRGLGNAYLQTGALDAAIDAYQQVLTLQPRASDHAALANLYNVSGRLEAALREYEQALALDPENAGYHLRLGILFRQMGDPARAEQHLETASALDPEMPDAFYWLGQVAYQQCRLTASAQAFQRALALTDNPLWQGTLASVYLAQGRTDDAQSILARLQAAPREDAEAHAAAADLLQRSGSLDAALREFQIADEMAEVDSAVARLLPAFMGNLLLWQGQLLPARSEFERALALWPGNAPAEAGLGDVSLLEGDPATALDHYERALTLTPLYRQAAPDEDIVAPFLALLHGKRGIALRRNARPQEATAALDQALETAQKMVERTPNHATANFTLGAVHLMRGETAAADAAFERAVQCDRSLAVTRRQFEAFLARFRGR